MRSCRRRKQLSIAKMAEEQQESSQAEGEGERNLYNTKYPTNSAVISLTS